MVKILLISVISPILILAVSAYTVTIVAHYISIWPLMLLELTGIMGENPEGFYGQWYDISIIMSLIIQAVVIFFTLATYSRISHSE